MSKLKILFVVNVDWFFLSHRLPIALESQRQGYQVHIATGITGMSDELHRYGFVVHPVAFDRSSTGLFNAIATIFSLWRIFVTVRPDLVHLVTIKPVLFGGLVARLVRVPGVVAAVSGLGFIFVSQGIKAVFRRFLVNLLYRLVFHNKNIIVIFQNPDDKKVLINLTDLPDSRVKMIRGSGVNLLKYRCTQLNSGVPVVLLASRLLVDKGVREFVEAARLLRCQGVTARFCLVGELDPENPASLTMAELVDWQREEVVEFWGPRTDMPEVFSLANVVVLPSYREGLPKVLLEAAACGRAVVTTDVPGCRDAIEPGTTGLLVPVRNAESLARAIEQLLIAPERQLAMGLAGRQLAEKEFDVRAVVDKHMAIYRRLLASR